MALTTTSRKKLLKHLPRGYGRRVAERMGWRYSSAYINMVATGSRVNVEIERELLKLAEERQAEMHELNTRAQALRA